MPFADRAEAGRCLADALRAHASPDVVVLALPRGGVPVAFEVAAALDAPLDVILVRKLGVPTRPELAMGAVGEGGVRVLDPAVPRAMGVTEGALRAVERREVGELERRSARLRPLVPRLDLEGRTAVLVDDGLATGASARAGCQVARAAGARRVVLAVPVAPPDAAARLAGDADEVVVVESPAGFRSVGEHYRDFRQVDDREVVDLLTRARGGYPAE